MILFFWFFFLSGFCSLVYQVVWLRVAMAAFGVTTALVSIVLSVFMAGLAIGSWGGGRLVRRLERRSGAFFAGLYAASELTIGISGLAVAPLLRAGRVLVAQGGQTAWGSPAYYLASGGWVALILLPFCACMGATIPLAMAGIRGIFREESSASFSFLYLANLLGALAGTVCSAFLFIELIGFSRTLLLAAGVNGIVALWAAGFSFTRRRSAGGFLPSAKLIKGHTVSSPGLSSATVLPLLFSTGLSSLGMEVVWTRQFIPFLGPVVYSFAAILAVYLAATACGSRIYRRWIRQGGADTKGWMWQNVALLAGVCSLLALPAADPRLGLRQDLFPGVLRVAWGVWPFCAVLGFLTSMLIDKWSSGDPSLAGRAYAVNTMGCILGPLLSGFLLLPIAGERWTLVLLSLPFFVPAIFSLSPAGDAAKRRLRLQSAGMLAAAAVVSVLLVTFTRDFEKLFLRPVVRRDHTATVIATGQGMDKRLLVNGVGMTNLTPITKMMAHLPLASLEAPPHRVLVLCFGMGTSFRSALSWGVPVTVVDLVPSVPQLFGYFHEDGVNLARSARATIVIDDARRFLERTQDRYDVIVVDPPPPVEAAGSSLLYSSEFYRAVIRHLGPQGILQQWLPNGEPMVRSAVARALAENFLEVRVFPSVEGWGFHFLASQDVMRKAGAGELAAHLPPAAALDLLEWGPASTVEAQFSLMLDKEIALASLTGAEPQAPALTDDRPVNEYYMLRRGFLRPAFAGAK